MLLFQVLSLTCGALAADVSHLWSSEMEMSCSGSLYERSAVSDSPICLDAQHKLSRKLPARAIVPEVPDVEENQRILAAHLDRMKAADENLRRTTQLHNVI